MTWIWSGDRALLVEASGGDAGTSNASARALAARLRRLAAGAVQDVVPGARSVLVVLKPGAEPGDELLQFLNAPAGPPSEAPRIEARAHTLPVDYGGEGGPDLAELARRTRLSAEEIVRRHSGAVYTVGFLGFMPGFAYLLGLPPALANPRLATPRPKVPEGSVGIGGIFTGVYPGASPGGWRLIGRTDTKLFDPQADPPNLLAPGDTVRFVPRGT